MTFPGLDHVDLRVNSIDVVRPFYDVLMPALGLTEVTVYDEDGSVEYYEPARHDGPRSFFGLHQHPGHVPDQSRIAFTATMPSEVDRLAAIVREAGGQAIEGPEIPYSAEQYYAVFFEDPEGTKFEICFRRAHRAPIASEMRSI
jgi:catechol 2,3-dioxygenase-like lactoylglutathione lyase family enzyme